MLEYIRSNALMMKLVESDIRMKYNSFSIKNSDTIALAK